MAPYTSTLYFTVTPAAVPSQYKQEIILPLHVSRAVQFKIVLVMALLLCLFLALATTVAIMRMRRQAQHEAASGFEEKTFNGKAISLLRTQSIDWSAKAKGLDMEIEMSESQAITVPIVFPTTPLPARTHPSPALPSPPQRISVRSSLTSFIRPFSFRDSGSSLAWYPRSPLAPAHAPAKGSTAPEAGVDLEAQLEAEFARELSQARPPVLRSAADWPVYVPPKKAATLELPYSSEDPTINTASSKHTVAAPVKSAIDLAVMAMLEEESPYTAAVVTDIEPQNVKPAEHIIRDHPRMRRTPSANVSSARQPTSPPSRIPRSCTLATSSPSRIPRSQTLTTSRPARYLEVPSRSFMAPRNMLPARSTPISAITQTPFVLGAPPRKDHSNNARVTGRPAKDHTTTAPDQAMHARSQGIRPAFVRSQTSPLPPPVGSEGVHVAPSTDDGRYPKISSPRSPTFPAPVLPSDAKAPQKRHGMAARLSGQFQQIFKF